MRLNPRERVLALGVLIVILAAATWWIGEPRYVEWRETARTEEALRQRKLIAERLLNQREELHERMDALRRDLPRYPREADVTSQLLRNLQRAADDHGLQLLRREPEEERRIGELYELAITCTWEGTLTALVHFLYTLQTQGAIVDIRHLTIAPVPGSPAQLRGSFTVDYAYSRVGADT